MMTPIPLDHWVQTEEGGGRIIGEACHMLDFFQFLVSPARVIEINKSSVLSNAEHISSSDNISANLLYDNGSVATLLYTALGSRELHKEYIEIYSQGKVIVIDDFRSLLTFGVEMKGWHSRTQDKGHMNELRLFADYVKGKIEAPIPLDDLVETTSLSFLLANSESIGKLSN